MKIAFNILGTFFLCLGIVGIFLPLMPTTVFLLLASACYLRGSDRLYGWLTNHRHLGPFIKNYQEKRAMPYKAKIASIAILWISLSISALMLHRLAFVAALAAIGMGVTAIILSIRTLEE